jgi:tetratricopeptide (TPR) repeat protein
MRWRTLCVVLLTLALVLEAARQESLFTRVGAAEPTTAPKVSEILKEATGIIQRPGNGRGFLLSHTLLDIVRLQISIGEFDDALAALARYSNHAESERLLIELAEAVARAGRRKEAEQVMQKVQPTFCCDEDRLAGRKYLDDSLRLAFIDYQIAQGNLTGARQTSAEVTTPWGRPIALQKLGTAYAKVGDRQASRQAFRDAAAAAVAIPIKKIPAGESAFSDEWSKASALWKIADAQLDVHDRDGAAETLHRLVQSAAAFQDGLSCADALYETAAREAKLGDDALAKQLFRQAVANSDTIKAPTPCPEDNKIICLQRIAKAQAEAGYYDEAMKTARSIPKDKSEAIEAIADVAKNGDIAGAVATALSLEPVSWGRTDALVAIVAIQIQRHDLRGALLTAEKIDNRLERAIASLRSATAFAASGDPKSAEITGGRIRLSSRFWDSDRPERVFDYQQPGTWGTVYDLGHAFTSLTHQGQINRAANLGAAAMALSQKLGKRYPTPYSVLFDDFDPKVVRRLARAHAASGPPADALAWARQIGSDEVMPSKRDSQDSRPVQRRVAALVGVAEGILERRGQLPAPEPD